jgi:nitrogen fixation/metabolism regulation signal transduction histidine kinase
VSLRWKFYLYLGFIHVVLAAVAVVFLMDHRLWFVALEGVLVLSLFTGIALVRAIFVPIDLVRSGVEFIAENEFSTKFREVKSPEIAALIQVYNQMISNLREERIRNEERENFLRDVIHHSPSGIVTLDLNERITTANPSAESLLGYPEAQLQGKQLAELDSEFAGQLVELKPYERRILWLHGRRRVKCQKLTFMDRGFSRPFFMLDELTEELHKTEKAAYGKLVRMMSHEVNNTVGAVNSLLQSSLTYEVQLSDPDQADYRNALQVAISRNERMNDFMQGFADVVRLPPPRLKPTDLQALVKDVALLMRPECEPRGIDIQWDLSHPFPPSIEMDAIQMEQLFINLLKNAVEAIDKDGTITIRSGTTRDRSWLALDDTGPGLSPEAQSQLFSPFFTTKSDGQGIGLTMVQEILLAHQFDFSLSNLPAGGCRFLIEF